MRLLTIHNVHRLTAFMREMRAAIVAGVFDDFRKQFQQDQQEKEETT